MPVTQFIRYQNRKIYSKSHSAYFTQKELARLLREGKPVQVIDHRTRRDITREIVSRAIYDGLLAAEGYARLVDQVLLKGV